MDFSYSPRTQDLRERVKAFMAEHVYPAEAQRYFRGDSRPTPQAGKRWTPLHADRGPQAQGARRRPVEPVPARQRTRRRPASNQEYAPLAEMMGAVPWASEVFNCSAPDTGNMEVLARYGTPSTRSVARAAAERRDPQRLRDDRAGGGVVRRHQHRSPHRAPGRRLRHQRPQVVDQRRRRPALQAIYIFMGKTDPSAPKHSQQSMVLVPDTPGVKVLRPLSVFGYDDAPHGHMEVDFHQRARAGFEHPAGRRPRLRDRPGPPRPRPHPPLHAPDRPGRTRAEADVPARHQPHGLRQDHRPAGR